MEPPEQKMWLAAKIFEFILTINGFGNVFWYKVNRQAQQHNIKYISKYITHLLMISEPSRIQDDRLLSLKMQEAMLGNMDISNIYILWHFTSFSDF